MQAMDQGKRVSRAPPPAWAELCSCFDTQEGSDLSISRDQFKRQATKTAN